MTSLPTLMAAAIVLLASVVPHGVRAAEVAPVSSRQPADFTALRQRPLFAPDRSAPAAPVEEQEPTPMEEPPPIEAMPAPSAPDWELIGLVRSSEVNRAVFRARGMEPPFSLRLGDSREGWTLTELKRFEAILDSDHGRATLRYRTGQ